MTLKTFYDVRQLSTRSKIQTILVSTEKENSWSFLYRVFILDGSNNEEQLLMNSMTFKVIHLSFALFLIMDTTIKALLVFERTIATGKVETYETEKSKKSCWIYIAIINLFPVSVVYATYPNAEFSQSACFALFAPRNTEIWINMLYLATFLFALLSFITLRFLILLNNKKLKFHNFKLSTRYQIRENLTFTYLMSSVLLTGLAVVIFYGLAMIILRTS
ncbi:Protein CBG20969 [Caenorhabditis briggsae]|uniref:Protein CBG20969 n=1 Tax=Caenorhabditis briggsae TaxID=6238 RepID=A8XZ27_CAEBR|nr:Protein CBG20969 [Caenorhabditis briggsae]CAP37894.2 Protein CBG20969 [Caenorhabditis briggsae]